MRSHEIVFVVGAGASSPYGFPLGGQLKDQIVNGVEDGVLNEALRRLGHNAGRIADFRHDLMGSLSMTIDDFLSDRPDYMDIGRYCVGFQIHQREAVIQRTLHALPEPRSNWIARLLQKDAFPNFDSFLESPYAVVTFNYDRLFEILLGRCIASRFNRRPEEAAQAVARFPIAHVHGSLGRISGEDLNPRSLPELEQDDAFFGEVHDRSMQLAFAHDPLSPGQQQSKALLESAKHVVFLGFGYGESNLARLAVDTAQFESIAGTSIDLKPRDRKRIEEALPGIVLKGGSDGVCFEVVDGILSGEDLITGKNTKKEKLLILSMEQQVKTHKSSRATAIFHETELSRLSEKFGMTEDETSETLSRLVERGSLRRVGMDGYRLR